MNINEVSRHGRCAIWAISVFFRISNFFFRSFFFLPDLLWYKVQVLLLKFLSPHRSSPSPIIVPREDAMGEGMGKKKKNCHDGMLIVIHYHDYVLDLITYMSLGLYLTEDLFG